MSIRVITTKPPELKKVSHSFSRGTVSTFKGPEGIDKLLETAMEYYNVPKGAEVKSYYMPAEDSTVYVWTWWEIEVDTNA